MEKALVFSEADWRAYALDLIEMWIIEEQRHFSSFYDFADTEFQNLLESHSVDTVIVLYRDGTYTELHSEQLFYEHIISESPHLPRKFEDCSYRMPENADIDTRALERYVADPNYDIYEAIANAVEGWEWEDGEVRPLDDKYEVKVWDSKGNFVSVIFREG